VAWGPLGLINLARPPLTLAQPIIDLAEEYLAVPSGIHAGKPLKLTSEQVEVLWAWYSVTPNGRKYIYNRKLIIRMSKGWAKSPIGMVCNFGDLLADVVPDGLNAYGEPVGRPHPSPWLQIAATAEDQTDNLYRQLLDALRDSDAVDDFRLDVGITRIQFRDRAGWIEPVTSSAGAREGQPISGATKEETHLWYTSNGGISLSETLRRNAIKMGAREIELTNAYVPAGGSVAEKSEASVQRGRGSGVLLVKREADPLPEPPGDVEAMRDPKWLTTQLENVYGQATVKRGGWVDTDRVVQEFIEANDDELPMMRRFFLNHVAAPEGAALDLVKWATLGIADARLTLGDTITLGFDGSDSGDATALYACRWPDWLVVKIEIWERPADAQGRPVKNWKVDRAAVVAKVLETCANFRVVRGYADDSGWQSEIDLLNGEVGQAFLRFPHRSDQRIGPACERFTTMVSERTLRHDGDPDLARHAANARKVSINEKKTPLWWRPARRNQGQPIDALSAAVSAVAAMGDAVAAREVSDVVDVSTQIW
jgi:hypothetical protein